MQFLVISSGKSPACGDFRHSTWSYSLVGLPDPYNIFEISDRSMRIPGALYIARSGKKPSEFHSALCANKLMEEKLCFEGYAAQILHEHGVLSGFSVDCLGSLEPGHFIFVGYSGSRSVNAGGCSALLPGDALKRSMANVVTSEVIA